MTKIEHSLIFLTYDQPNLIDQRLREIEQHMAGRDDFEVVVFDNGSTRRNVRLVLQSHAQKKPFPLRVVFQKPNVGFSIGFNKAVEHADGTKLYLISDDVTIFGDFIEASKGADWSGIIGQRIIPKGAGWNDFPEISIPYLDGYFLALLRSTWDSLGGFDIRFAPHDFEDVDLSHRATHLEEVPGLPIRHAAASTIGYGTDRFEHTVRMRALFAEKWGLTNEPERP